MATFIDEVRAVQAYLKDGTDSNSSPAGETAVANKKRKRANQATLISSLKSEISELERNVKEQEQKKQAMQHTKAGRILQYLLNAIEDSGAVDTAVMPSHPPAELDSSSVLDEEKRIHSMKWMTGFVPHHVSSSLVCTTPTEIRRRYVVQGSSSSVPFTLTFDVDETKKSIETIDVDVGEDVRVELMPLITRILATKSVIHFITTFTKMIRFRQDRMQVFRELANAYPEYVSLPHGHASDVLVFTDTRERSNFSFQVLWKFSFSTECRVTQTIQIHPRVSDEVSASDKNDELKKLPKRFQELVETKGVKAAIEIFILVALRQ